MGKRIDHGFKERRSFVASLGIVAKRGFAWVARYELLFLLGITPLLMFPSRFSFLGLIILLLLWISRWVATGRLTRRTPMDVPIMVLLAMSLVSLYPSVDLSLSWPKLLGIILGIAVFYGLVNNLTTERDIHLCAWALGLAGPSVALISLAGTDWTATKLFSLPQINEYLPRLFHLMPQSALPAIQRGFHPNEVGGTLALLLPLPLALFLFGSRGKKRWLWGAIILVMGFTMLLTQSRSALMGLGVALAGLSIWRNRRFLFVLPFIAAALLFLVANRYGLERAGQSFLLIDQLTNRSPTGSAISRLEIWPRALAMISDYPYTGIGLNTFPLIMDAVYPGLVVGPNARMPHAHNLYLQTAVDLGIPGLLAFLALLVLFWTRVKRANADCRDPKMKAVLMGVSCGILSYMVFGLTDTITLGAKPGIVFWIILSLINSAPFYTTTQIRQLGHHHRTTSRKAEAGDLSGQLSAILVSLDQPSSSPVRNHLKIDFLLAPRE